MKEKSKKFSFSKRYPVGEDWFFILERDQPLFITAAFISSWGKLAEEVTGFGFRHQLYVLESGTTDVYRSKEEWRAGMEYFFAVLRDQPDKIRDWIHEGERSVSRLDLVIKEFGEKIDEVKVRDRFEEIIETLQRGLLFGILIPRWVLTTIDENIGEGQGRREFEDLIAPLENLRNSTRFLEYLENVISRYWDMASRSVGDRELMEFLTPLELNRILKGESVDIVEVRRRKTCLFWGWESDDVRFSYDQDLLQAFRRTESPVKELSGNIAFRGYVDGRVRIVNSPKDIGKMREGEILVSITTNPALMPAMKKASAIVTDEGGMACHAAIMARELKKPCIVGTKKATKIFHDGDLVEVDADRGVVRILEKKKDDRNAIVSSQQKIRVEDWQPTITRNMSFWHQCLSSEGHFLHSKDFGINEPFRFLAITKNGTETTFFSQPENLEKYSQALMEAVRSTAKVKILRKKYEDYAREFIRSLRRCDAKLSLEHWDVFVDQYRRYAAALTLTSVLGRAGSDQLNAALRKIGETEADIPGVIALITYPDDWTPLLRSRLDLLEIGKKVQNNELSKDRVATLLREWLDNHRHIPVNFCEEPWTEDDAQAQLDEVLESDCAAELDRLQREQKKKLSEKKRLLAEIGNETVSTLAYAIAEGTYLNEFRKNVFSRVSLGYRGIFSRVAEMAGSDNWRDCFYLTPEEMRDIISGKEMDIEAKKRERQIVGYVPDDDGSLRFLSEEETNAFSDFLDSLHGGKSEEKREVTEISGFIASTGKVRGIVKVILSSKDFEKMETGDILVTAMTSVDFVPIMERAGAFVTNEGGITSHAAIVSREMGKPCIIGTKIATQVLKDGDMVEVDAEEGVVRVLKSE